VRVQSFSATAPTPTYCTVKQSDEGPLASHTATQPHSHTRGVAGVFPTNADTE
jgi:hypothetical protein